MNKDELIKKLQPMTYDDAEDDPDTLDDDMTDIFNSVTEYNDDSLTNHLSDMMDSKGIITYDDALDRTKDSLKDLKNSESGDELKDDPQYQVDEDNIDYLQDQADGLNYVGPEWHGESYGTFTGDRTNYDAVQGEDVADIASELIKELKGADDREY